ncbi:bifunctional DNA-binding transcriptional regulator/O6-methylguanine-DNA methyltransferase Ada [Stakelama pacifica]|uniref:methylated-DNA--[protein]-cysteine S-methyltransferase n=1 Tax=Stakelama pacifica TaxID=517720 RepID=A0A4R6FR62_9SPHN|nr:bifunctional DNA-binding transcriptional regulator/O6-methylguanine-DNA methyltransferase Ada [Stakelama pacifica]TDN83620.1 DNA-O6-methylguanine--protein-cysteine S-methyltransferase /transcriptional regulator Ada [Stakelama pacifica]GGO94346.1 bifunctional transcriptional activator/DNA repair enzyme protein Ada [Stakelama pacifica]
MDKKFSLHGEQGRMAWAAFDARDRAADGRFVVAVKTTRIYCRPSCPARRPRRENVEFFADGAAAGQAGYRPCLRCRPDDAARDAVAVTRALALIEGAELPLPLDELSRAVGYAPHHFQRLFKRATGVSPAAYARALKAERARDSLAKEERVTDAIYAAGYSGPSRFYADSKERLGMTPGAWKRGGEGVTIRWTIADTDLGPLLIAATDRGLCRVSFDEDAAVLVERFPNADIVPGGDALADLAAKVVAEVETPGRHSDLPIDVRGTAFQEAAWQALRRIPPGETRSYAEIAAAIGKPGAVRAAGSACGANHVAILIPCHRVQRGDGSMGGYAYGVERKRALRKREGVEE